MTTFPETDLVVNAVRIDDALVVTISGELDADTAPQLTSCLEQANVDVGTMVLDMAHVPFCDSVGLSCLLELMQRGVDLRVIGSRQVIRLLTLLEIDHRVTLASSVAEALDRQDRTSGR